MQNALQHPAIRPHFLVVTDANLGEFFFKEKCKSIVNGHKNGGDKYTKLPEIHRLGTFYMAFSGYFLLEQFGRKTLFVKYIYHFNKSLTDDFRDKANSYAPA